MKSCSKFLRLPILRVSSWNDEEGRQLSRRTISLK